MKVKWRCNEIGATFYRMSECRRPPLCLRLLSRRLISPPRVLLVPQMVLVDRHAQHDLCAVLVDYELIQMLFQRSGRDVTLPHIARAAQWAPRRLVWLVEGREALPAEVGAVVRRAQAAPGSEAAAADVVEGEVGGACLLGSGDGNGAPYDHFGV